MSETTSARRTITGILLLIAAAAMIIIPAVIHMTRTGYIRSAAYESSGRIPETPRIRMPDGTIRVNDAEPDDLCDLYGIGETLAGMIVSERETNGPFFYPEDLTHVKGIGLRKLEGFRDMIDLN